MLLRLRLWWLKRKARLYATEMDAAMMQIGCGVSLARTFSSDFIDAERKFLRTIKKLERIDPNYPATKKAP